MENSDKPRARPSSSFAAQIFETMSLKINSTNRVIDMPVNVTLEYEMNGPEGIADTIEQLKLPDDAEIDADGEVMTVQSSNAYMPNTLHNTLMRTTSTEACSYKARAVLSKNSRLDQRRR